MIVWSGGGRGLRTWSRWPRGDSRRRNPVAGPGCMCWGCSRVRSGMRNRPRWAAPARPAHGPGVTVHRVRPALGHDGGQSHRARRPVRHRSAPDADAAHGRPARRPAPRSHPRRRERNTRPLKPRPAVGELAAPDAALPAAGRSHLKNAPGAGVTCTHPLPGERVIGVVGRVGVRDTGAAPRVRGQRQLPAPIPQLSRGLARASRTG
jgi:hypothetical protein